MIELFGQGGVTTMDEDFLLSGNPSEHEMRERVANALPGDVPEDFVAAILLTLLTELPLPPDVRASHSELIERLKVEAIDVPFFQDSGQDLGTPASEGHLH